ncbi:MAG TPA: hypothetical protein ENF76_06135 [Candidatus Bathyarchaeota archaeon]|nr:hypothetical protein [Candidatus Bathyarchaeota archaeon]
MLITVPRDALPGIDDPVLTVISGMDGGDTVYDCVGTWNFNYTEPPSPAGAYRVNPYVHDVAVRAVTISKTIVCQTYSLKVNITVKHRGDYNETVQVKVYFNDTAVETQSVELQPQEEKLITIECYANVDKGLYFTSGYALPVPYESATANNKLKDGSIIVSMVGDVTGPDGWPDGKVNMRDIGAIARCFGSQEGDPDYNANYDIVYDGKINMRDIGLAARHFGETDP